MRFVVRPDQVEALADMLHKEDPDNIALVVEHLETGVRAQLLAALPAGLANRVLATMGRVRYVEPEVILNLKEELERRLAGSPSSLSGP